MSENIPGPTPQKYPVMQTRPPKNLAPGEKYPGINREEGKLPEVFPMPDNKNVVLNSNFPQLPVKRGDRLPLPSLEDIRDSEKIDYYSVEGKEPGAQAPLGNHPPHG